MVYCILINSIACYRQLDNACHINAMFCILCINVVLGKALRFLKGTVSSTALHSIIAFKSMWGTVVYSYSIPNCRISWNICFVLYYM